MVDQKFINIEGQDYSPLDKYLESKDLKSIFLVCDSSIGFLEINSYFNELENRTAIRVVRFSDFKPNPNYESIVKGVERFINEKCDSIIAVGGGSAIDVAKCIKLYSNMDHTLNYLNQEIVPNDIPFVAMPTTAGTGSESTRYAVIYYLGEKQSITHESCIPEDIIIDPSVLKTLPIYQKKSTMMDAFCHAIESYWSVNSTPVSKGYAKKAIHGIIENLEGYLANKEENNYKMMIAANYAGRAINITQTTAGHAMCYKITSIYGYAHGHAAALCNRVLIPWIHDNLDKCIDPRGKSYLSETLDELSRICGFEDFNNFSGYFRDLFDDLKLDIPAGNEEDIKLLSKSVNPVRLKNFPVLLDEDEIEKLYRRIIQV